MSKKSYFMIFSPDDFCDVVKAGLDRTWLAYQASENCAVTSVAVRDDGQFCVAITPTTSEQDNAH